MKFQAIKGVRDILPPESAQWNRFEQTARDVFTAYGYGEIRLPVLEETGLFARSIGGETDVVSKEMYTFEDYETSELLEFRVVVTTFQLAHDSHESFLEFLNLVAKFVRLGKSELENGRIPRTPDNERVLIKTSELHTDLYHYRYQGEREILPRIAEVKDTIRNLRFGDVISLRPEATASVCRAYIEHGMQTLPGNVKLYYMGPMFRRERPQKGRYRQFYQIGAEVLGQSDAPAIDAEVIEMLMVFFERAGLTQTRLAVNSIGCKDCRPKYVELLREKLREAKDRLGPDSQRRIETNPLRVLDSKSPEEQSIIEALPRISDHLCAACREHFAKLQAELKLRGIEYEINWRLVRGLDYYTRTTFEVTAAGLGSQNAVCGGGRYDGLVELLGGPPTKGIGFAIGTDRAILSIQESRKTAAVGALDVFVAWMGPESYPASVGLARKLRSKGLSVEIPPEEMKFKKALGLADKLHARHALIIGSDEIASGQFTLKNLATGEQQKLSEGDLIAFLKAPVES